jgi:hypothetical protein
VSTRFSGEALLRLPVRWNGIELGRLADVVLDPEGRRVLGFDVLCGDERRRFLPIGAGSIRDREIAVGSALLLFGEAELAFYRRRGRPLAFQRGLAVERGRRRLGHLLDVVLTGDGTIVELVVRGGLGGEPERVALDDTVKLRAAGKAA